MLSSGDSAPVFTATEEMSDQENLDLEVSPVEDCEGRAVQTEDCACRAHAN